MLTACAPEAGLSDRDRRIADDAVEYLRTTDDEMGIDVLVVLHAFGQLTGHEGALETAEARTDRIRPAELERFGALLEIEKPPLGARTLEEVTLPTETPDPGAALDDRRVQTCVEEMTECRVSPECLDYAMLDSWGYVLTHQAVWLIFAEWLGCDVPLDVDALRERYAARLVAEARFDPRPSDLFFERLAMLGQLGYEQEIEPEWVDALRASQDPAGCFPVDETVRCHPHPTALALWTLAHASRAGR